MNNLTGAMLKTMILESHSRIQKKADYLNAINVFPVADGDTGLNINTTLTSVVKELEKQGDTPSIKEAAKAISKGAFIGAKGNSGVILSQFFVGFAKTIENEENIDTQLFADALVEGSKRAYKAVMNPREGTILTVVKETAEAAKKKTQEGAGWRETVEHCYEIAQKSTADTPNLLEDLKSAGVVDSGALGFVYLIQGWLFVISNTFDGPKVVDLREGLEGLHNKVDVSSAIENLQFRYCTEAMIIDTKASESSIREQLVDFGDSLIVIESESSFKLHIHSNKPKQALEKFANNGHLVFVKIDDMKTQTTETHS
ncbi:MAG: DAK2 domain-containing protein [Candidatus Heimdallarchaeota archaeon]|nr:DAK2 domain-containing protein [Candidatus Heimdallarchaeota archaeon]